MRAGGGWVKHPCSDVRRPGVAYHRERENLIVRAPGIVGRGDVDYLQNHPVARDAVGEPAEPWVGGEHDDRADRHRSAGACSVRVEPPAVETGEGDGLQI